jgi:hypothetical protein
MSTKLADYFRSQAEWRDRKAEEYPEDKRNVQSAAALRSLADYVEPIDGREAEGPSGKRILSRVYDVEQHLTEQHLTEGTLTLGGERTKREVARYGFGQPVTDESHKKFLEDLLPLCLKDAYEFAEDHHDDPTGQLHPFEVEAAVDGVRLTAGYWRRRDRSTVAERERWVHEVRTAAANESKGAE